MPKIKTVKSAAKRFRVTGSGSIRRNRANKSHILTKKNKDRKRALRKSQIIHPSDGDRVKAMLTL
jgi:large subunit ribosomal protein L35